MGVLEHAYRFSHRRWRPGFGAAGVWGWGTGGGWGSWGGRVSPVVAGRGVEAAVGGRGRCRRMRRRAGLAATVRKS